VQGRPRQIRALDDALAATKPVREGSACTVGEARALDARHRERQSAQWTASAAVPAASRDRGAAPTQCEAAEPHSSEVAAAAAAAAAERVTPVTLPKSGPSVGGSGSFGFGVSTQVVNWSAWCRGTEGRPRVDLRTPFGSPNDPPTVFPVARDVGYGGPLQPRALSLRHAAAARPPPSVAPRA
jgi:hypothetical protein